LSNGQSIFIEVTNYRIFRCGFCPQTISEKPPQHMDMKLAKSIISQLYDAAHTGSPWLA